MAWNKDAKRGDLTERYGAALILDLKDSSFVWDQSKELAQKAVVELSGLIQKIIDEDPRWNAEIGNFTGDGFLLIFSSVEDAVNFTSVLLDQWEGPRQKLQEEFTQAVGLKEIIEPFLILRSGIELGKIYQWGDEFLGPTINRAQRCESESKHHILKVELKECGPARHCMAFITNTARNFIEEKKDYYFSGQLDASFKGTSDFDASTGVIQDTKESIYAVRPKSIQKVAPKTRRPETEAAAAEAASMVQAAERMIEEADKYVGHAQGQLDRTSRGLIDKAIAIHEKALEMEGLQPGQKASIMVKLGNALDDHAKRLDPQSAAKALQRSIELYHGASDIYRNVSPEDFAMTQNNRGIALWAQAELLAGEEKKKKLGEAEEAYRAALRVRTYEASPSGFAMTQNNLGIALNYQAGLLAGEEKKKKLGEAEEACRAALRVRTYEASPSDFAGTQNNLGAALWAQAGLLAGEEKKKKLGEAEEAFREALRVYTYEASPSYFATTQNNLGVALNDQAGLLAGEEKKKKLGEAEEAYRAALRVRTYEASPSDFAMTQNNLGGALCAQAELLAGEDKKKKLGEAEEAFREALRVYTCEASPWDFAMTQNNLGEALCDVADGLRGAERSRALGEAREALDNALMVYDRENFPCQYEEVQKNLAKLRRIEQKGKKGKG